jgi:D-3-phosphoglycerate dehydrogenase
MRILVSMTTFAVYDKKPLEMLETEGYEVVLNPHGRKVSKEELMELASGCAGIVAGTEVYDEEVFDKLTDLKVLSRAGTGMDSVDIEMAERHGVIVKRTPDAPTQAVAELVLTQILDLYREVSRMDRDIRAGVWKKRMGNLLSRKTVGIVGAGYIGTRVAGLLKPFDCQVLGYDPYVDGAAMKERGIEKVALDDLLRESDVVTIHIPYSDEAHHFMDSERLKSMKEGSILINASRGGLVDEEALCECLKDGHLKGAAVDTFEKEPYEGPLRDMDNVLLTPHIGSYARESRIYMEVQAVENLIMEMRNVK